METLKIYSDVKTVPVNWLWYPYIPSGKITLLQGDPGDGKSTMTMNLIAAFTTAGVLPDGQTIEFPKRVIYQCSEDSPSDTIKPRLVSSGADCNNVAFIDEELISLSLDDEIIREAIVNFKASLLVIDPFQAYLGDDTDLSNAKHIRRLMKKLSMWASTYDCAILLIGHMTKNEGSKDLYRGLGSIDLVAAARSVLQVYRVDDSPTERCVRQIKSSLAPRGYDIGFSLDKESGFVWKVCERNLPPKVEVIVGEPDSIVNDEAIKDALFILIESGTSKVTDIQHHFIQKGVSFKTLKRIKKIVGIKSVRKNGCWYWELPHSDK